MLTLDKVAAMRRPRFRPRTALSLVLLVALGLWAEGLRQRAAYCLTAAAEYQRLGEGFAHMKKLADQGEPGYDHPGEGAYYGRTSQEYLARAREYRRAAYRPWLAVPDDPAATNAPRWRGPWR